MTTSASGTIQPLIPVFSGEGYEFWSIRIKTILRSQDLWELVENGFNETDENQARLRENRKKDAKTLAILQQAVHDNLFSRIAAAQTARQAWTSLQSEFQGDTKVMAVRLQGLRREFESLFMRDDENISDFLSRAMKIVNQKRAYGEPVTDQLIVEKVLRSLPPKWDHVVAAIEEARDLRVLTFDQLMGSLQSHEVRINRSGDNPEIEKAFYSRNEDNSNS